MGTNTLNEFFAFSVKLEIYFQQQHLLNHREISIKKAQENLLSKLWEKAFANVTRYINQSQCKPMIKSQQRGRLKLSWDLNM